MAVPRFLVIALSLQCAVYISLASVLTIEDGGYKGLLVAIRKTIDEDPFLVDNIKELFTNASRFLYSATGQRAYFREITIAVPATWSTKPTYEEISGNFFSNAHVRIDHPNPEYGDAPYTLQPGGCGEPGQYIHLTPWFVKELREKTVDTFGTPDRQLVHEWAHLRYGVFDEYGIPGDRRFPMFYRENGKMRPTSCIRDIKGWIENRDGGPCRIVEGGYVEKDCIFIPDMNSEQAKASIMYMPFIPAMEGFCDDKDDKRHNPIAPTKQNTLCNYRSSWKVITDHPDFSKKRVTRQVSDPPDPVFRVIKPPAKDEGRYVLVLDVSGSMNGRPMTLLHRAATRLVEDRIPDGAHVGIVQFSTNAYILQGLTKVDNATRMQLSRSLPQKDDGGTTAIGKGIQEGIKVLKTNNVPAEGGLILLITDGEENVEPSIVKVLPELVAEKVIVNTVAFGADASKQLENVTSATGGKGYFFSNIDGTQSSSALDSAFLESVTSQADIELQPVQVKDETFVVGSSAIDKDIRIDNELGKNTIFTFTSSDINQIRLRLISPNGKVYEESSPEFSRDTDARQRIQVKVSTAETGLWKLTILGPYYDMPVSFSVTSEPKDIRQQPIRVRSWLSDLQLKYPAYAKVFAEAKKGYRPVVGASVLATVDRPMGKTVDIMLKDDGLGADVTKNDGIYTGFFTHFNGNGRYAVIARVLNDGSATIKNGAKSSAAIAVPKFANNEELPSKQPSDSFPSEDFIFVPANQTEEEEDDEPGEPAGEFERTSDAGAFRLENWVFQSNDIVPPGSITDLEVVTVVEEDSVKAVILQWTSPGGDMDSGNATYLELRASIQPEVILFNFNDTFLFKESLVLNGSLVPLPVGQVQFITVSLPADLQEVTNGTQRTVYFAIKAQDESGNISPGHNVAAANFGTFGRTNTDPEFEEKTSSFRWWPVSLVVGVFCVVAIILIAVSLYLSSRKKRVYKAVAKGESARKEARA